MYNYFFKHLGSTHMQSSGTQFGELLRQVKAGSEDACRALFEEYGHAIYNVVRRRLSRKLRSQYGYSDICQAVWASFYAQRDQIDRFETPQELLQYLRGMAGNKVIDECRRRLDSKKGLKKRELHYESESFGVNELEANDPQPSENMIAEEQVQRFAEGQPGNIQEALKLRMEGMTYREISEKLNVHERALRRIITRLERRIEK